MSKVLLAIISLLGGLVAIALAILIPAHLRAMDDQVMKQIGRSSPGVVDFGLELLPDKLSSAKMVMQCASDLELTRTLRFTSAIQAAEESGSAWRNPPFQSAEMQGLLSGPTDYQYLSRTTVLELLRNRITRGKIQDVIQKPDALRVLQNLRMTNLTLFAPAESAAGVPFEVAVTTTALLMQEPVFGPRATTPLREEIINLNRSVSRTNANPALEEFYLDMFALAKRLTWDQLTLFITRFDSLAALNVAVRWVQENEARLPVLFTEIAMSKRPDQVSSYLTGFGDAGYNDMRYALGSGSAAFDRLLELQQPVYHSELRQGFLKAIGLAQSYETLTKMSANSPWLTLFLKFDLLFFGAFLVVYGARRFRNSGAEGYVWFPQFRFARQLVFSVLLVALLVVLGEPYLAHGKANEVPPPTVQWSLPILAETISSTPETSTSMINPSTIVALSIFFLIQASLYTIGLVKLAEIRRQPLSSAMKLKLLDNEENLFDAGLYAGLFGTASSLVLLTLGVIKPSLMSAYASTLFGILFVAILKILHVRPYKRQLIIASQAETQTA